MPQLINTPSNQEFPGCDKLIIKGKSGKNEGNASPAYEKINKNNRNEKNLSEFLNSPFSPALPMSMGNPSLPLAARENISLTLKKRESLLEINL